MKQLLDTLDEQICICQEDGKVIFCNQAMLKTLGCEEQEVFGENILRWIKINGLNVKGTEKQKITCEVINKQQEKKLRMLEVSEGVYEGQTVRFLIGKWNNDKVEVLEAFFEANHMEICIKNGQGHYAYMNKQCAKRLDTTPEEMLNKRDEYYFTTEECEIFKKEDDYVRQTLKESIVEESVLVKGRMRTYEVTKAPIEIYGEVFIGIIMRDITTIRQMEKQCIEAIERFKDIYEESEEKVDPKNVFEVREILEEFVGTESFNIWIYNKEGVIRPYFKDKILPGTLNEKGVVPIEQEVIQSFKDNTYTPVIVTNTIPLDCKNVVDYSKPLKYIVLYPVMFKEEFLGLMSMYYDEYPTVKVVRNYIIKHISQQLGFMIKKECIYNRLNAEWQKRIIAEEELDLFLSIAADLTVKIIPVSEAAPRGKIIDINSATGDILGWTKEAFMKFTWEEILHPDDLKRGIIFGRKIEEVERNSIITVRWKRADGTYAWLNWSGVHLKEKGYSLYTAKDISYQKELEAQKEQAIKIMEMEQIKNDFFSNISHEIKTPIAIILASIQVINQTIEMDMKQVEEHSSLYRYMKILKQNGYRLLRLVNNLIDVTKIEAGYYALKYVNVNIVEVIEEITLSIVSYAENKGIELVFDTEIEEEIIACDPEKIERIILNLLSNAIKHTPREGKIIVDIKVDEHYVCVSVLDTGRGIPEDKLAHIFNRFMQVDNGLTRKGEGSGIGLSLVKSLVEMHEGEICAKSKENEGTQMIFKLPRRQDKQFETIEVLEISGQERLEKCNIEFSDIYDI